MWQDITKKGDYMKDGDRVSIKDASCCGARLAKDGVGIIKECANTRYIEIQDKIGVTQYCCKKCINILKK